MIDAIAVGMLSVLAMHPSQETFAEMQFNAETGRVEVSLRLASLDEQAWIRSVANQPDPEVAVLVQTLRWGSERELTEWKSDKVATASLRSRYHWIGRQDEGAHVWWYFEYEPHDGKPPTNVRCRFFDQPNREAVMHSHSHGPAMHRFNVVQSKMVRSVTTTAEAPVGVIPW